MYTVNIFQICLNETKKNLKKKQPPKNSSNDDNNIIHVNFPFLVYKQVLKMERRWNHMHYLNHMTCNSNTIVRGSGL